MPREITMPSLPKTKLSLILCWLVLSILKSFVVADSDASAYEGKIFINLYDSGNFAEYTLSAGNLVKTVSGKVTRLEKDGRTYLNSWTVDFKKIYEANRIYRYDAEERLAALLAPYDLERLQAIQKCFFRHTLFGEEEQFRAEDIYLTGPGRRPKYFVNYTYDFYPDRQFSHVIYRGTSSALINLETKRVTFPFGIDDIEHIDWNATGQFVAYSFQGYKSKYMLGGQPACEIKDRDQATLVIVDSVNQKASLRRNLGRKYVADLAWSPDSSHIGVMIVKPRLGIWPWQLLGAVAGHPVYHNSFSIEVYDIKGNMVEIKELEGSYKLGSARIVWN